MFWRERRVFVGFGFLGFKDLVMVLNEVVKRYESVKNILRMK